MEAPVRPGDVLLGRYRVERVLGHGGMGVVAAVRHLELGELFAIKFLLPQALGEAEAVGRFLREARAAARLKGEHVAKVYDVGRLDTGSPYMALEYLDGADLKEVVRSAGPLPWEDAVLYLLQAADAIAEAHSLGIVHRDIKPANLFLIRRPNGAPCVKVLDFGISKQMAPDNVDLTRTGSMLGSPLYMSPEQMMRRKDVDPRSDIWSMGVVLYELLTGKVPFPAETLTEVVGRVLQEEPLLPSQLRPGLPLELDHIVARCLQKRPEHRFQHVEELAAPLRALLGTHGAAASAARASRPDRATYPGMTSLPGAVVPARASQPGYGSQPGGGPPVLHAPERASVPAVVPSVSAPFPMTGTGASTWSNTGNAPGASRGRKAAAAAAALGVAALAAGAVWLAQRPAAPPEVADAAALPEAPRAEMPAGSLAAATLPDTPAATPPAATASAEPAATAAAPPTVSAAAPSPPTASAAAPSPPATSAAAAPPPALTSARPSPAAPAPRGSRPQSTVTVPQNVAPPVTARPPTVSAPATAPINTAPRREGVF
ncbi:protein kinase domain-containing protein [Sorangium sp. So ce131]|uniref:serine/threonine-protein kinase n=1 Tax=Sorangium sp. So ce131 TaxID=3133282 RepID=UPI003F610B04